MLSQMLLDILSPEALSTARHLFEVVLSWLPEDLSLPIIVAFIGRIDIGQPNGNPDRPHRDDDFRHRS